MKFLIISHVLHKSNQNKWFAYEPYVREMNLWIKNVNEITLVAPISIDNITPIETAYQSKNINFKKVPNFNLLTIKNKFRALFKIPKIIVRIYKAMIWADHIHLRCPGNIGLIGCFVQIFFPSKPKTIKYAGNWDPDSKQPWSYKLQKSIIRNRFLTRHAKVLVYGEWRNQSKNIVPFFTATYSEKDIHKIRKREIKNYLKFIYVGALHSGKQPLLSVKIIYQLKIKGYQVQLDIYGEGDERAIIEQYIKDLDLSNEIKLHGNKSKEVIKHAFMEAHFLLFMSKSEGWPKVVAEAMFWGCVPITSKVSCVPWMLDYGNRGILVNNDIEDIIIEIDKVLQNKNNYDILSSNAQRWSQKYTLEFFENEIKKLIYETA
ncbi:MAG: glycosyltransferase [Flavobacteriales bacterium]|nr:glycosyltransferase [Flavobacteriales bacterium]NCP89841.1 glycosyltransferase [Flavobacteriales bacterium]NCQ15650.1 glycosyltransferase [Flavobacteriales bacterium]